MALRTTLDGDVIYRTFRWDGVPYVSLKRKEGNVTIKLSQLCEIAEREGHMKMRDDFYPRQNEVLFDIN